MIATTSTAAESARAHLEEQPYGWSLPQPFYVDQEYFALDVQHVFVPRWIFVAHSCEIAEIGDWIRVDVAGDSIIIVRGKDGALRSFFNTCRHRGSLVCLGESGHARRLVCPYHQWSYHLDGSFAGARYVADDFDPAEFGLSPVHCATVGGYVFVCLADEAPDFATFADAAAPFLAPHELEHVKVAHTQVIVEQSNWKLVMENNRECYHCVGAHPELMHSIAEFDGPGSSASGHGVEEMLERKFAAWDAAGITHEHTTAGGQEWRVVRIPFTNDSVAMTLDGSPACTKLLGHLDESLRELGSVRVLHLPNTWNHVQSDHVVSFSVLPISATETKLVTRWLVHEDAVEGIDYDLGHLTKVWEATNDQDRTLAENNQRGIATRGYRPGPYVPVIEAGTADFTQWYRDTLLAGLRKDA
ncbi:MAG: Rieske (2Fe-2S) domain protein [Acidimicrobiales bacterium]|nr:Rieske (2Fe-2S) domain protein [Acidimicrobiales bacterium]